MFVDKDKPFYNITQVAEILGISTDRLRTYDEEKLVAPTRYGKLKKRLYSELDIEWLQDLRTIISKNKMNIYSFKLILSILDKISQEDFEKLINKNKNDKTWEILYKLQKNPNYNKLYKFYKI